MQETAARRARMRVWIRAQQQQMPKLEVLMHSPSDKTCWVRVLALACVAVCGCASNKSSVGTAADAGSDVKASEGGGACALPDGSAGGSDAMTDAEAGAPDGESDGPSD
jgi:ribulose 1,5-bisphosphate carboxylase large subunit-like protein